MNIISAKTKYGQDFFMPTVENALFLFNEVITNSGYKEQFEEALTNLNNNAIYIDYRKIAKFFKSILTNDVGLPLSVLITNPTHQPLFAQNLETTLEMKNELKSFLFDNNISNAKLNSFTESNGIYDSFFTDGIFQQLSFLKYNFNKNIIFIEDSFFVPKIKDYSIIVNNKFKKDISDLNKINFILRYINSYFMGQMECIMEEVHD